LRRPKEVFLFGCNTLATKEKDRRTPEEYLRVLLADGIPRTEAERIVEARYGGLGDSFSDRMRRIFSGAPNIYGFDSIGPSGKTATPFLEKYFHAIGNYKDHLDRTEAATVMDAVKSANNLVKDFSRNEVLDCAMTGTSFAQISGLPEEGGSSTQREKVCNLLDASRPI
jgi:hypothetical protein